MKTIEETKDENGNVLWNLLEDGKVIKTFDKIEDAREHL